MKKVLIVVDMQNDFVDGALGTKEAVAIVDNVAKKIEAFDEEIIVTYDTHQTDYMDTREGKYLPVPHCIENTKGWQLQEKVEKALEGKNVKRLKKTTFGAVELVKLFEDCDQTETEVTLIGLCTDICVVSNAMLLKAYYPEMNITIDASCCAGVTPESHQASLTTMKMCQMNIEE